jgi:hypothetical protein
VGTVRRPVETGTDRGRVCGTALGCGDGHSLDFALEANRCAHACFTPLVCSMHGSTVLKTLMCDACVLLLPALVRATSSQALRLGSSYYEPLGDLPATLRELVLGECFNQPLCALPYGLEVLVTKYFFDQHLGVLPPTLRTLSLPEGYSHRLENAPPDLRIIQ